jgi:hypothetical protein
VTLKKGNFRPGRCSRVTTITFPSLTLSLSCSATLCIQYSQFGRLLQYTSYSNIRFRNPGCTSSAIASSYSTVQTFKFQRARKARTTLSFSSRSCIYCSILPTCLNRHFLPQASALSHGDPKSTCTRTRPSNSHPFQTPTAPRSVDPHSEEVAASTIPLSYSLELDLHSQQVPLPPCIDTALLFTTSADDL